MIAPRMNLVALAIAALMAGAAGAEDAAPELELYVDVETKQVFTEPGPNRRRLGSFRRVEPAAAPAPAVVAPSPAAVGAPDTAVATPEAAAAPPATPDAAAAPAAPASPSATAEPAPTTAAPRADGFEERIEARQRKLEERIDKLASSAPPPAALTPKKWYDSLSLRGYLQVRYNDVIRGDEDVRLWNDSSVGEDRGFLIRRARLIVSGDVSERVFIYLQPDFANNVGDTGGVVTLRDAYGDLHFDKAKEYRLRVGQSKIPYSFEDMQSSQNRLALDRNDALNSSTLSERDLGAFFYYAPAEKRALFRDLVRNGLKGSGDYGMFAFGFYNGQGMGRAELNDNLHTVARFTYPLKTASGQIYEFGLAGYTGKVVPTTDGRISALPANLYRDGGGFRDRRVALHAVMYPQPFGIQAEWNWGEGPGLNDSRTAIENQSLQGGYVQLIYKLDKWKGPGLLLPFVRWQYYDGAMKYLNNTPQSRVNDWEFGVEWQIDPSAEIALVYHRMNRTDVTRAPYNGFEADALRMQLQFNF